MPRRHFGSFNEVFSRSVVFAMLAPATSFLFGPFVLAAIAMRLDRITQGYYFTFSSLLGLQLFLELGLTQVIVQFASHEWSQLGVDEHGGLVGSPTSRSRLASLFRFAIRWYSVAAVVGAAILSLAGFVFFSQSTYHGVNWVGPWISLSILSAINLSLSPLWALLEGCNQIVQVYRFRFLSSALQNTSVIASLLLGFGLWTTAAATGAIFILGVSILLSQHRQFFAAIRNRENGMRIEWRTEILPMQWRIGLSWLSGYFMFSLFTPVLFHYRGAVIAGQMGMTWALVSSLLMISSSWITPKAARFGSLIARGEYAALDQLALKSGLASFTMVSIGALMIWVGLWGLGRIGFSVVERFLPLLPTSLFLLAQILMQVSIVQALYLRAHKQDPFAWLSFGSAALVAFSACYLGRIHGALGVAVGYLGTTAVVILPVGTIIFWRCKRKWHEKTPRVNSSL